METQQVVIAGGGPVGLWPAAELRLNSISVTGMAISNGLRPGLAGFAKSLADELGPRGIRVFGLLPGRIATDRMRDLDGLAPDPTARRAANESAIPLRRYGAPEEFGRAGAFLLSPAASYVTGVMLSVDGGGRRGAAGVLRAGAGGTGPKAVIPACDLLPGPRTGRSWCQLP